MEPVTGAAWGRNPGRARDRQRQDHARKSPGGGWELPGLSIRCRPSDADDFAPAVSHKTDRFCGACRVQSPGRVCGTTSPHPDQGLITALPMEVTAVVIPQCAPLACC